MGKLKKIQIVLMIIVLMLCNNEEMAFASKLNYKNNENIIIGTKLSYGELEERIVKNIKNVKIEKKEEFNEDMYLVTIASDRDTDDIMQEIDNDNKVDFVQKDYELENGDQVFSRSEMGNDIDELFNYQWGLNNFGQLMGDYGIEGIDINILKAWEITQGRENVIVGILDTGIDIEHDDLKDAIYVNKNEIPNNNIDDDNNGYIDDVSGWDFVNDDKSVYDDFNEDLHGTFVAGIIGARKNNIGICGVAPKIKIIPLKVLHGEKGKTSNAIKAIEYAEKIGVNIINCSWGGEVYNEALKRKMENSNILFICSSGNEGLNLNEKKMYPTCFESENILSVGAINNKGDWGEFANYGKSVDVAAPGVLTISTIPQNGYHILSGTSFAAPYVTGIAALLKSMYKDINGIAIKNRIENNVIIDEKLKEKVKTCGRVDAYRALINEKGRCE